LAAEPDHLVAAVIAWIKEPVPTDVLVSHERAVQPRPKEGDPTKQRVFSPDVLGFVADGPASLLAFETASDTILATLGIAHRPSKAPRHDAITDKKYF